MVAVLLALGAAVGWGCSDFLAGLKARNLPVLAVLVASLPTGFLVIVPVLAARADGPPGGRAAAYGALAGLTGTVGIAALYRSLAVGTMGVVAPIAATGPVIPFTVGLARGERPSSLQLAGAAAALAGIVLVGTERHPERTGRIALGVGLALLAAGSFGVSLTAFDAASNDDPYWAAFVVRVTACIVVGAVLVGARTPLRSPPSAWPALAAVGLFDAGATVSFAVATTRGLISVVAVLASLAPVFIALLARLVLDERLAPTQLAGAAVAISGAVLISAA